MAWWERIVDRRFGHVDMVIHDLHADERRWVVVESFGGCIQMRGLDDEGVAGMLEHWPGPVLWFCPRQEPQRLPVGFKTCVSLAKAVVGCKDWRVQTPLQLYRWAKRNGGLEVGRQKA